MESACPKCTKPYNSYDRKIIMLSCGDSVCLVCFDVILQPQDSKLTCPTPDCGEELVINQKFKENIQKLKGSSRNVLIFCNDHPQQLAELFCMHHNILICDKCAIQKCKDHIQQTVEVSKAEIQGFCDNSLSHLTKLQENIERIRESIQRFKSNESSDSNSSSFMKIVTDVHAILIPLAKDEEQMKEITFLNGVKETLGGNKQLSIDNSIAVGTGFDDYSKQMFNITQKEEDLLKEWVGMNLKVDLIYRGSRDGFKVKDFYQQCQGKGPTLSLIKSEHNQVFGAYTSLQWQKTNSNVDCLDQNAFIFSLTKQTKHPQYRNKDKAVRFYKSYYLLFGSGSDILLSDDCNLKSNKAYSDIGGTFQAPQGVEFQSKESRSYLAGSHCFKVIEVETYLCTQH